MISIHTASIQLFLKYPNNYHLVNQEGTIKAVAGRREVDERVHQAALALLDALESEILEDEYSCFARLFAWVYPSKLAMAIQCKKTEFIYKINQWAQTEEPEENRAEAARLMIKAYGGEHVLLDLSDLGLRSLPSEILKLNTLVDLNVSGNPISDLPKEIRDCPDQNLRRIHRHYLLPVDIAYQCKKAEFIYKITLWCEEGNLAENRTEAARRIINAYNWKSRSLNLSNLDLSSLPREIGELTELHTLELNNNQLTDLPEEIGKLIHLQVGLFFGNPIKNNKTNIEFLAAYPFLLKIPCYENQLQTKNLQAICQFNGLALKFIHARNQSFALISIAINQNPASIAFAESNLISYDLASRAVALDVTLARFVPPDVIDVASILSQIDTQPYLLSLLIKVGALDKISDTMYEDAITHDYRLLGCMPLDIQNSELGYKLILEALTQNPKAYYMIEPAFFNEKMLTTMIHHHKNKPDLKPILKDIISKMDTQDEALVLRMSDLAYPLSQYFHDDKEVLLMLVSKYGLNLMDVSDSLRADCDIISAAIQKDLVVPFNPDIEVASY